MYGLEIYHRVRRAVLRDGMSEREAARAFGIDRGTVSKMLRFSEPPGYRIRAQRPRSRMDAHAEFVDQILISDREAPKKQRHTVKRIFERNPPFSPTRRAHSVRSLSRAKSRGLTTRAPTFQGFN